MSSLRKYTQMNYYFIIFMSVSPNIVKTTKTRSNDFDLLKLKSFTVVLLQS